MKKLTRDDVEDLCRVPRKGRVRLKDYDPAWVPGGQFKELETDELKERAEDFLEETRKELAKAQEVLWATDRHSVLIVLQAMDAAGKDGTIKHVMSGVNPQGCQVFNFKKPSEEDIDHTFLWRFTKSLPEKGRIGIFNRSYYEDVLVVRVHPHILDSQKLPHGARGKGFWEDRFDDINNFERHLDRNGTTVVKIFLNLSKAEQRKRFLERLSDPDKHWKVSDADLAERKHWDAYQTAYEEMLAGTSTKWAPWWVIPADHKYIARALVAAIITRSIKEIGLKMPTVDAARKKQLEAAHRLLRG